MTTDNRTPLGLADLRITNATLTADIYALIGGEKCDITERCLKAVAHFVAANEAFNMPVRTRLLTCLCERRLTVAPTGYGLSVRVYNQPP
jgi:hypothetical protein